jgi:hypothetical protein
MHQKDWVIGTLAGLMALVACEGGSSAPSNTSAAGSGGSPAPAASAAGSSAVAKKASIPADMLPERMLPEIEKALLVPDTDRHGAALFTDIQTVKAGSDVMFCTYTSFIAKDTLYLHDTKGIQSRFGHHVIMQYTTSPQPTGTHECAANSLEAQQSQIIGGAGEGSNITYPDNVVSEIPAGAQLIINHHWINTSEEPVDVQAEMVTVPPSAAAGDLTVARSFIIQTTTFNVAPHGSAEAAADCKLDHDVQLISALGHEHEWGTHVRGERMGDDPSVIFDHDFDPELSLHPKVMYYTLDKPYRFKAGDSVRMACKWNNTTDAPLKFPGEMCVMAAWQIGAEHDSMCFDGTWVQ